MEINLNDIYGDILNGNIKIQSNHIYVNGKEIKNLNDCDDKQITLIINGDVKNVDIEGNLNCQNIKGDVDCSGHITCNDIDGDLDITGNISCNCINGDIESCGNIKINKK